MTAQTRTDELFRRVMADHAPGLWRLTAGYARPRADCEDLYQDILLAIWNALPTFRRESSLRTFVYRIGHDCGISHRRSRTRRPTRVPLEGLATKAPSPESATIAETLRADLVAAIQALPNGQRQVVMLHLEGLTPRDIGAVLGITANNASVRLHRARAAIRDRLDIPLGEGD